MKHSFTFVRLFINSTNKKFLISVNDNTAMGNDKVLHLMFCDKPVNKLKILHPQYGM